MSLLRPQPDEALFSMHEQPLGGALETYLRNLAARRPFTITIRADATHILSDLAAQWPTHAKDDPAWEDMALQLWNRIADLVYPLAANLYAKDVVLQISVANKPLPPPPLPRALAIYIAFDVTNSVIRHCFLSPQHVPPPAAQEPVAAGLVLVSQPAGPHFHEAPRSRSPRTRPHDGLYRWTRRAMQLFLQARGRKDDQDAFDAFAAEQSHMPNATLTNLIAMAGSLTRALDLITSRSAPPIIPPSSETDPDLLIPLAAAAALAAENLRVHKQEVEDRLLAATLNPQHPPALRAEARQLAQELKPPPPPEIVPPPVVQEKPTTDSPPEPSEAVAPILAAATATVPPPTATPPIPPLETTVLVPPPPVSLPYSPSPLPSAGSQTQPITLAIGDLAPLTPLAIAIARAAPVILPSGIDSESAVPRALPFNGNLPPLLFAISQEEAAKTNPAASPPVDASRVVVAANTLSPPETIPHSAPLTAPTAIKSELSAVPSPSLPYDQTATPTTRAVIVEPLPTNAETQTASTNFAFEKQQPPPSTTESSAVDVPNPLSTAPTTRASPPAVTVTEERPVQQVTVAASTPLSTDTSARAPDAGFAFDKGQHQTTKVATTTAPLSVDTSAQATHTAFAADKEQPQTTNVATTTVPLSVDTSAHAIHAAFPADTGQPHTMNVAAAATLSQSLPPSAEALPVGIVLTAKERQPHPSTPAPDFTDTGMHPLPLSTRVPEPKKPASSAATGEVVTLAEAPSRFAIPPLPQPIPHDPKAAPSLHPHHPDHLPNVRASPPLPESTPDTPAGWI